MRTTSPLGGMRTLLATLLLTTALPAIASAQQEQRATLTAATLNVSALQPGKPAMAAVVVDIKPGFHAQSNTPTEKFYIKYTVKVTDKAGLTVGEPTYPKGEDHNYPAAGGILNVYDGRVIATFPVEAPASVPAGSVKLAGTIRYQICDDTTCFAPETTKFEIPAEIVAAGTAVTPKSPEFFKDLPTTVPTTANAPATAPASSGNTPPKAAGAETIKILGFTLRSDAYLVPFTAAFVIGIVFNAVPCVLPVLPIKVMGFYENSQHNRAKCISFGLAFSLGVIAAFGVLGMLVIVLKVFNWGEVFSNPWFAAVLVVILVAMALNMFGLFTVNLPTGMYALSPRHDTYFGNFLFGILTAALSTPCTFGMFVGLLTWALPQPAPIGLGAMLTVGAGMAFPYLVLSAFPELARNFPRAGPWAELVKQLMGFLLLAVAAYFAQPWISKGLNRIAGKPEAFWWVLFGIILAAGVFLVVRTLQFAKTRTGPAVAVVLALLLVVPSFVFARQFTLKPFVWQPYTPALLAEARSTNRVVMLDFTADWCATCHFLEATVLNRDATVALLRKHEVELIKVDLSDEAAPGWALLNELKAKGIPLTAVYTPGAEAPALLPGIYGVEDLKAAIEDAARAKVASADPR